MSRPTTTPLCWGSIHFVGRWRRWPLRTGATSLPAVHSRARGRVAEAWRSRRPLASWSVGEDPFERKTELLLIRSPTSRPVLTAAIATWASTRWAVRPAARQPLYGGPSGPGADSRARLRRRRNAPGLGAASAVRTVSLVGEVAWRRPRGQHALCRPLRRARLRRARCAPTIVAEGAAHTVSSTDQGCAVGHAARPQYVALVLLRPSRRQRRTRDPSRLARATRRGPPHRRCRSRGRQPRAWGGARAIVERRVGAL